MRDDFKSSSEMLKEEISQWIIHKMDKMEGRAKFSSKNAVRFLYWSNDIFSVSPIVASYTAMHATEEAVAAFIAAAKEHGHKKYAKEINLHNHKHKALVSIFAQRVSLLLAHGKVSIAIHPKQDALAYRVPIKDGYHSDALHLSSFSIGSKDDEANGIPLGDTPLLEVVAKEADRVSQARNKIMYATENGCPTGFKKPKYVIYRNTALSIGLIWAAVDMYMYPDRNRPIVDQVLRGMAEIRKGEC